ncbi:MAG: tetratricopeptide repeat protein [Candidatus Electrothrix sp. AUS3]|nr:tetratricopeptide repeat protein [Candidatus Electrothrix gigas]
MDNYYKILNIQPSATEEEIKKAISRELRIENNRVNLPNLERRQAAEKMIVRLDKAKNILLDEAQRAQYDRALQDAPRDERHLDASDLPDNLVEEGWRLLGDGCLADALYVANNATEINGKNPEAWALLAKIKARKNEYEDAIYEYKRAVKLAPDKAIYHIDLGDVYQAVERFRDALDMYENAVRIEPTEKEYKVTLAGGYLNMMTESWVPSPDSEKYVYATQKEHILQAKDWINKAEALAIDDLRLADYMKDRKEVLRSAAKTIFCGKYWPGILSLFLGLLLLGAQGFGIIYIIFGVLYFVAYRLPQYEINRQALTGERSLSKFDRLDNFFFDVANNTTVHGGRHLDLQPTSIQEEFIFASVKIIINQLILPFAVLVKLITNYNKGYYSDILADLDKKSD